MTDNVLELQSIEAGYGDATVLRDVTMSVGRGEVVALLGPNGAGKTTLLSVVSGVISPQKGRVLLAGEDVTGRRIHERVKRGLCHIPEGHGVFPSLTVRENIILASPKGKEDESLEKAANAFPILGDRTNQISGSLSGGQQQMLAVIRAYLQSPELVLIDEVSMGLAPLIVEEIFVFIADLARSGTSLLLVEQYVSQVLGIASSVYILNQGQISFNGTAESLSRNDMLGQYFSMPTTSD